MAVEEARDADGLRVFRYDHRGLPLAVTHRFWPQRDGDDKPWDGATSALWSSGSSWAPSLPDAPRASLTDWLALDGLTASTEVLIEATYDAAARPVRMDYPEGMATRLSYDEGGRLSRVEVDRGAGAGFFDALASVAYDARGKATQLVFGNGVQTVREHDAALERLTRLYTKLPGAPDVAHQDLRYAYDPAGHVLNIEDALSESAFKANQLIPNSRGFTYDARYRLVRATGRKHNTVFDRSRGVLVPSPDENDYVPYDLRYAYDEVGNFRVNQEYASSGKAHLNYKAGRIDLFNGRNAEADDARPEHGNFRYDANGSVTHTPRQQELGYAFDGQPVYVDLGGGGKVRYFRHGDQRVVRMVNKPGVMAVGVYLGPWEYHSRQGTVSFEKVVLHVHGEGRVAQVERVLDGADPDSLAVFYVHEDHLGSGHVLTDADGELLSQEEYFAYGRSSDRRDARNRYRWIGVERDEDTGLCVTGPRLYDPVVGRFGSGDPVVQAGRTPFGYAGGEPVGRRDPGGYQDQAAQAPDVDPYAPHTVPGDPDFVGPEQARTPLGEVVHRKLQRSEGRDSRLVFGSDRGIAHYYLQGDTLVAVVPYLVAPGDEAVAQALQKRAQHALDRKINQRFSLANDAGDRLQFRVEIEFHYSVEHGKRSIDYNLLSFVDPQAENRTGTSALWWSKDKIPTMPGADPLENIGSFENFVAHEVLHVLGVVDEYRASGPHGWPLDWPIPKPYGGMYQLDLPFFARNLQEVAVRLNDLSLHESVRALRGQRATGRWSVQERQ